MTEKSSDQNEVVYQNIQDCVDSLEKHIEHSSEQLCSTYNLPETRTKTITSDLPQPSISAQSYDEKAMEDLIERMKNEEQRMEEELKSMEHGEGRMKYEITLKKHCKNRMEHEIELMKRREKLAEEVVLVRTSIYDDEKYMQNEIKQLKKHNKHTTCVKERMKHYEKRLKSKIRFTKNETELNKSAENLEELCNELQKRETKSVEHSYEIHEREIILKEHSVEQFGRMFAISSLCMDIDTDDEISPVTDQPKYDIFISCTCHEDPLLGRIMQAIPQWYSTHLKGNFSTTNIKICVDNTSTAVIAIIDTAYELNETCQVDMIHIFKRQFPLVLVVSEDDFKPSTSWLTRVWHAFNTQKVFLNFPNFEENLRNALTNAVLNLSPILNISRMTPSIIDNRSKRFLGDLHEWTVVYSNPVRVSQNYRQIINDPLRISTNTKLRDIYYNYIRLYFEDSDVMTLFGEGANENDIRKFIRAYTQTKQFSEILNHHLAANVLFYFESTLDDTVDYQLVKCLIDFVALCIYREELQSYVFSGTVHRGVVISEEDLLKYVVGSRIMNTTFLSTSKDKEVAEVFSGIGQQEFAVVCTYMVHNKNNRRTALDISPISCFPHEREVLILPFSAFYVESVTRSSDNSKPIEMTLVEDDSDASENIY